MRTTREKLVDRYLKRLAPELQGLKRQQRQEILSEIRAHVDESLAETGQDPKVDVRTVLERLGDPADIAGEAYARFGVKSPRPGFVEVAALILLPIGGIILPILGWVAAVILLWVSNAWTAKEKLVGTIVIPGGLGIAVFRTYLPIYAQCVTSTGSTRRLIEDACSQVIRGYPLELVITVLLVVFPLLSLIYLIVKLRQRSRVPVYA